MELLTNIIISYLKHNKRLVVPRLGAFIVKQPEGKIVFSELLRNDDGVLISLLVAYGYNELSANGLIDRLSFTIRHAMSKGESYVIPGFGEFREGANNTICFRSISEPEIIGGTIKPPVESYDNERIKQQCIQRIRQQQSESITGHSTHRKIRSSQTIAPKRPQPEEENFDLAVPDDYLRGLTYKNRKNQKDDENHYGSYRKRYNRGSRIVVMTTMAVILSVGIWFTWRWIEHDKGKIKSEVAEVVEATNNEAAAIESSDTLNIATLEKVDTTATPTTQPSMPFIKPTTPASNGIITPLHSTTLSPAAQQKQLL